jgi:hypothetical protein
MATTTTNFGWDIPQSTDLVKDGATAIAALGQDIDTAFVDFKGGTTGQVLKKSSATDLDVEWGTASSGLTLINTTSFSGVASQAVNSVFNSTYQNYRILINIASSTGDINAIGMKLRVSTTDTSTNYNSVRLFSKGASPASAGEDVLGNDEWFIGESDKDQNGASAIAMDLFSPNEARSTNFQASASTSDGEFYCHFISGIQSSSTQFDGFNIINSAGNTTGTIRVYGYNN